MPKPTTHRPLAVARARNTSDLPPFTLPFPQLLQKFLETFPSANTRSAYLRDLTSFFQCLHNAGLQLSEPQHIQEKQILFWVRHMERHQRVTGTTPPPLRSLARRLSAVASFCKWAHQEGHIGANPARLVPRPRPPRRSEADTLTAEEAIALLTSVRQSAALAQAHESVDAPALWRLLAEELLWKILLGTGLRISEALALRVGDWHWGGEAWLLETIGKGFRSRRLLIPPALADSLNTWSQAMSPGSLLFLRAGALVRRQTAWAWLQKRVQQAGIAKKISPHSLRATVATLLHLNGEPLLAIQDLLGHSRLETTTLYVKKAAAQGHSPGHVLAYRR